MATKKKDHIGARNGGLFCFNCGYQGEIITHKNSLSIDDMKKFQNDHKNCVKVWKQPVPDLGTTYEERLHWWNDRKNGEKGVSACTIFNVLNGIGLYSQYMEFGHPLDLDDFRRCYLLMETIPEFYDKKDRLKTLSPQWSNLIDNWETLTVRYETCKRTNKGWQELHDFMQRLLITQ